MSMSNHTPYQSYKHAEVPHQEPIQPDHVPLPSAHELNVPPIPALMWQNGQTNMPQPNAGSKSAFSEPQPLQMNNNNVPGKHTTRRSRNFVPSHRKDEFYWIKRRKNNEAARKSREKRRTNDLILAQKVLLLLQENLQLKKDLLAVRVKYHEVGPEEVSEFHRKMTDGDLISAITQNLNLADYGIPDGIIKTFCNGMELGFSSQSHSAIVNQTSSTAALQDSPFASDDTSEYYSNDSHDQRASAKVRTPSASSPSPMYENRHGHEAGVTKNVAASQYKRWMDTTTVGMNDYSLHETKHRKSSSGSRPTEEWKGNSMKLETSPAQMDVRPFVRLHHGALSTTSTSSSASEESMPSSSCSSIADAQMLQDFVQMSWRKASEHYKSSTSSSDEAQKDGGSDYSSFSDSNSTNSHSSSPKASVNNDESNECSSNDEKGHRLPYKLRFKLAGMQSQPECNP